MQRCGFVPEAVGADHHHAHVAKQRESISFVVFPDEEQRVLGLDDIVNGTCDIDTLLVFQFGGRADPLTRLDCLLEFANSNAQPAPLDLEGFGACVDTTQVVANIQLDLVLGGHVVATGTLVGDL